MRHLLWLPLILLLFPSCKKDWQSNNKNFEVSGELKGNERKVSLTDVWEMTGKGNLRASFGSDSLYLYDFSVDGEVQIGLSIERIANPYGPWKAKNVRFTTPGTTFQLMHAETSSKPNEQKKP